MKHLISASCLLSVVAMLASVAAVQAGTIRDDVPDSEYRDLSKESRFDAVGNLTWSEGGYDYAATATLISPEWLLTGAHCVDGTDFSGGGITNMTFDLGDNSLFPDITVTADQWFPHPGWGVFNGDLNKGYDIGLIHLSSPITSVAPARLYEGSGEIGQVGTFVGYGRTGTGITGDYYGSIFKRAGNQVIDNLGGETTNTGITLLGNNRILYTDFDSPTDPSESTMGSSTPLPLEYMTASGDSGGPLFIEDPVTGLSLIAGVDSFGSTFDGFNNADYGDANGSTRVAYFVPWIRTYVPEVFIDGDFNGDGYVGLDDLQTILDHWNQYVTQGDLAQGDGNNDGYVGLDDLQIILDNWNHGTQPTSPANIPEPAAATLMLIACAALSLRR